MVQFGEFLKTWSLRSNSVTRQVSFNRTKIGGKCQNSKATFWVIIKQCGLPSKESLVAVKDLQQCGVASRKWHPFFQTKAIPCSQSFLEQPKNLRKDYCYHFSSMSIPWTVSWLESASSFPCDCQIWKTCRIDGWPARCWFFYVSAKLSNELISHYSKSQIFVQKFNFDKTPTFHEFFTQMFLDNFSGEIKVVNS